MRNKAKRSLPRNFFGELILRLTNGISKPPGAYATKAPVPSLERATLEKNFFYGLLWAFLILGIGFFIMLSPNPRTLGEHAGTLIGLSIILYAGIKATNKNSA